MARRAWKAGCKALGLGEGFGGGRRGWMMSRFKFQCHNDIPGFCIHRIPLCNLLYQCCEALVCQSQKICPVALLHDWKTKKKSLFLPEDNSCVTFIATKLSRDKICSASPRILAQASSSGHGGWQGASCSMEQRCPGLWPPHLLPVLVDEWAPVSPATQTPPPAAKAGGQLPIVPGQEWHPSPSHGLQQCPALLRHGGSPEGFVFDGPTCPSSPSFPCLAYLWWEVLAAQAAQHPDKNEAAASISAHLNVRFRVKWQCGLPLFHPSNSACCFNWKY